MFKRVVASITGILLIALFFSWVFLKGKDSVRAQFEAQPVLGLAGHVLAWGALLAGTWLLAQVFTSLKNRSE